MIALVVVILVVYFWLAVCVGTMQRDRYEGGRGYVNESDEFASFWAGIFWPITILVWTAKGTARWMK